MAKILFCQEKFFHFQSVARLSACLKQAGHKVDLVIGGPKEIAVHAGRTHPDLVAFSVFTPLRNYMLSSVRAIKAAGMLHIPVIAGGYDPTFAPEVLESSDLDIVCRGEGEKPIVELCSRIDAGQDYSDIPNLWVKKNGIVVKNPVRPWLVNLDELPFEDRDLYGNYDPYFKKQGYAQVFAGRGCPYACSYCFNNRFRKLRGDDEVADYYKLRGVDNVIEELLLLKDKYKVRYIVFNDSTLTHNKSWLFDLLKKHKKDVRIPFSLNAIISEVDEEVGRALVENGYCERVKFALETGNEDLRKNVLNKKITNAQFFEGASILKRCGIKYGIHTMMAVPGETLDMAWETITVARTLSAKDSFHVITVFNPFPGLDITECGIRMGLYKRDEVGATSARTTLPGEEGGQDHQCKAFPLGSVRECFYGNFRSDAEGKSVIKLSRFSYLAISFPWLRPFISLLIKLPDNFIYRAIWSMTHALWHNPIMYWK